MSTTDTSNSAPLAGEDQAGIEAMTPPEPTPEDIATAERRAKPVFTEGDHIFANVPMAARSPLNATGLHYVRDDWYVVGFDTDPLAGWDAMTPGLRPDDAEDTKNALAMLNVPGVVEKVAMGRDIRKLFIAAVQMGTRNDKMPMVKVASEKTGDRMVDVRPLRYMLEAVAEDEVVTILSVAPTVTSGSGKKTIPAVRFESKKARVVIVCAVWQAEQVPGTEKPVPMFSIAGFFATNPATVPTHLLAP